MTVIQMPGAFHHVNRVHIKFAGDSRLGLVLSETEHADARHQNYRGVRMAHRG
jgi:hypothetical protein